MKKLLVLLFLTFSTLINAQEYKSFEVINVSESEVWPAVYKTMQSLKLPKVSVDKNSGIGETGYFNYTALMIKNRCRFRFEYLDGDLTVSIFGRQYMSDNGWADNMLPMTKKQALKLLEPIEKQLSALSNTAADSPAQAVATSTPTQQPSVSNKKITGIYDDFGIIKTENPDMELMAINNNGNIIGYSLWENKEKVKAVVCKENNDSEAIILEFDENGLPSYMKIQNLVIRINASSSGKLNLFIKDSAGNYIGEQQVAINALPIQTSIDGFMENNTNHGPYFEPELMTPDLSVSDWLGYSSSALSQIANGLEKNVVSLVAIEFAKSLGVTLADPENKFFLNEISTCVPIVVTAITPFVQAALGLTVTAASISTVAAVGVIAGGLKISWDAAMRIKERHWPSVEIIVSGNTDVRTGAFGEFGREYQLYARSNYPEEIIWNNDSYELEINKIELGDEYYIHADDNGRYFGIKVKAKELLDKTSYPVLQAIQIVNGKRFTKEIKLDLIKPTYYFVNDCSNCEDDISNQTECADKLKQCLISIRENLDAIYFVIDKDDNIVESNRELTNESLHFIRTGTKVNHGFIPLVSESGCSFNCEGLADKETIITLAHEAMNKIKINENKIKTLQKNAELNIRENQDANNPQLLKIASDINNLEEASEKIRNEYGDKINKIAEKGTIQYPFDISDANADCYGIKGIRIKGAHWSRPFLTILLSYDYVRKPCHVVSEYGLTFDGEGVNDITYKFFDKDNNVIMDAATSIAGFSTITMDITEFEQTERIEFYKSNPAGIFN